MEQYISKSDLVTEIERRIEAHKETLKNCDSSISEMVLKGSMSAYQSLLHFLSTLEVKEEITTDAFVKKACGFIRNMVDVPHNIECEDGQPLANDYIKYAERRLKAAEKVVESFKKYMKGE